MNFLSSFKFAPPIVKLYDSLLLNLLVSVATFLHSSPFMFYVLSVTGDNVTYYYPYPLLIPDSLSQLVTVIPHPLIYSKK